MSETTNLFEHIQCTFNQFKIQIQMSDCNLSRRVMDSSLLFGTRHFFTQKIAMNALEGLMVFWLDSSTLYPTRNSGELGSG